MGKKTAYVLQKAEASGCPTCNHTVELLVPQTGNYLPMFYICWRCRAVYQVAVGKVKREEEPEHENRR